jgi:hypothetical protein
VKDQAFYEAAAAVIPLLLLAAAIDTHAFRIRGLFTDLADPATLLPTLTFPGRFSVAAAADAFAAIQRFVAIAQRIVAVALYLTPVAGEVAALAALESRHSDWGLATLVWASIAFLFFMVGRGALKTPPSERSAPVDVKPAKK